MPDLAESVSFAGTPLLRLLIADDDPTLRIALRLVLEDAGHEVVEATTEPEARFRLREGRVDLALIDAGMSGLGVRMWSELQREPAWHGRALLVTGDPWSLGPLADHADVLGKPFDYDQLLSRIESTRRTA